MVVSLAKMKVNECGMVVSFKGGSGAVIRMQNLGILQGRKITKLNGHFWKGPVVVRACRTNIALGYGMAEKVMVEVNRGLSVG